MSISPGSRLGRYEVRSLLGSGGMGEVYRAYDHDLEREVAVKVLSDGGENESDRARRFVQEAKAASALSHPNVATVFEIGTQDNVRFIAMELVPGQTLRDRMRHGALPLSDALDMGMQIAAGLAAAHKAGIVHRDIKPENVIIRPDGYAKILDFGLAKLREIRDKDAATLVKTAAGTMMGTLGYMAPEQLSGGDVTPSADVFSLGVVLYEMISGHQPFEGNTATQIATAILSKSPKPLNAPTKLAAIVSKALCKSADERYPTASELLTDLRGISGAPATSPPIPARSRKSIAFAMAAVLLIIAGFAAWSYARAQRQRKSAAQSVATAERLLKDFKYVDAYETANRALANAPNDQRLRNVIAKSTTKATFNTEPPGATIYIERHKGPAARTRLGTTPLTIENLPLADYVVTFDKSGYAPAKRPLPMYPLFKYGEPAPVRPATVSARLFEASRVPADMVAVEGGDYKLAGSNRASNESVKLSDFLIDRYEVTNSDFEAFVRSGGYRNRELWTTVAFTEVGKHFRDTTGLPAPRSWSGGAPPRGLENHPVADVTWHEASAYARWRGKQLPSIYQWEKAARYARTAGIASSFPWGLLSEGVDATERMNFNGRGTLPVDAMPFGVSPAGAYQMAGNVSEWTRNPLPPGYAVRGGSWNDALYSFTATGAFPAMYASAELGFRCVKPFEGDGANQGEFALSASGFVPTYRPVGDAEFEAIRSRYVYSKSPLKARVVETLDEGDWTREKIEYEVDGRVVPAYLYLPKNYPRPLQAIHFSPAGDVYSGWRTIARSVEITLAPVIRAGRAVFAVVAEGFIGRPHPTGFSADSRSVEFVDYTVRRVTELRRGLDYLETRPDIDAKRIGFYAISAGTGEGVVLLGVEPRYRSVMFVGTGVAPEEVTDTAGANRINFASRIVAPKLMLQGRYDESAPLESEAKPFFRLMRQPKRLEVFEGGHVAGINVAVPTVVKWFDETLGRVQ